MQFMRTSFLILILLFPFLIVAQPEKERLAFVNSFTTAVAAHDGDKVIGNLTESYVHTQLKEFLHNNKDQFLDELFGGMIEGTEDWMNVDFHAIDKIEFVEFKETGETSWDVTFRIKTGSTTVMSELSLIASQKKKKGKFKYGFEGAVG
jgi:hypothetical protein